SAQLLAARASLSPPHADGVVAVAAPSMLLLRGWPLLRAMSRMELARDSLGLRRTVELKRSHMAACASTAPPTDSAGSRACRSVTAAAHSPHTHFPWNRSRTRPMYVGVHSSAIPQHSHRTLRASAPPPSAPGSPPSDEPHRCEEQSKS